MANTFIDLDPETIEAPFLGQNVGKTQTRVRSRQDASPLQAEVGGTPQQRRPRRTYKVGPKSQQNGGHLEIRRCNGLHVTLAECFN